MTFLGLPGKTEVESRMIRAHELAQAIIAKRNAMVEAENTEANSSWKITVLGEAVELAEHALSLADHFAGVLELRTLMTLADIRTKHVEHGIAVTHAPAQHVPLTDGEVTFYPFIGENAQVGYRCEHSDGRVEYLYLNPSTDDGMDGGPDGGPGNNVFLYQGTTGDPAEDAPHHFYYIFDPEDWNEPDGINEQR